MRFTGPFWRVAGSIVSWALFTFCFTLLFEGAITVMGLGGYCASGGAYVIAVECPDAVAVTMPLSIFGGLAAVAIGVFLARGFGVPLVQWAWPILFIGLGAGFLIVGILAFAFGGIVFVIIGVVFVIMGLVPLIVGLRADARELFLGAVNVAGEAFTRREGARQAFASFRFRTTTVETDFPTPDVVPTAQDWAVSILLFLASAGAGIWLGNLLFASFSG